MKGLLSEKPSVVNVLQDENSVYLKCHFADSIC